jgi:hypothetical protein
MSKRFGRNQKRALNASLAKAASDCSRLQEQYESLRRNQSTQAREDADAVRRTAHVLGRYFVSLKPRVIEASHADQPIVLPPHLYVRFTPDLFKGGADISDFVQERLYYLDSIMVKSEVEPLHRMEHVRVRGSSGAWAYHVAAGAFEYWAREDKVRFIATQLAEMIADSSFGMGRK